MPCIFGCIGSFYTVEPEPFGSKFGERDRSVLGLRVRVKVTVDVSVRWAVVLGALAVHNCLKLWEALMDSFTCVVLFGAALMPVSG